jgi:polyisoprenoid-binding protein YceI
MEKACRKLGSGLTDFTSTFAFSFLCVAVQGSALTPICAEDIFAASRPWVRVPIAPHFSTLRRAEQKHTWFSNFRARGRQMTIAANRLLVALIVAGAFICGHGSGYAQTSTWKIDPAHSSVIFEITHMAVSHVHGSLTNVNGVVELNGKDITKSSVEATIDTTTVSTGVVMRDNNLKSDNFFNVQKYPQITFKSSSLRRNSGIVQLLGDLTLNGVTRSVTLDLDPVTGAPCPGNIIPSGRFSRLAAVTAKLFPALNSTSSLGNYHLATTLPNNTDQQTYRLDQNIDKLGSVFFRYTKANYDLQTTSTESLPAGLLAATLMAQQDPQSALIQLQKAVALRPGDPVAWYRLSQVQRRLGNTEEQKHALAEFTRLRTSAPSNSDAEITPQQLDAIDKP